MASKKVSTLNALTSAGDDDLLYIADTSDSGASYASKRITVQNFLNGTASANALAQEITDRTSGDTALSNRLDVLEADPTTATDVAAAIAVETAARQAADALALPLAGGTMTGDIELGSGGGGPASATLPIKSVVDFGPNYENITVSLTTTGSPGSFFASDDPSAPGSDHVAGTWGNFPASIDGVNINENDLRNGDPFTPGKRWWAFGYGANNIVQITLNSTESFTSYTISGFDYNTPVVHGSAGGGSASTIGADGTATFGGLVSASAVPTNDEHLVNKLYADSLVAGVDLSGIATNADAIAAETAARIAADALKLDLAGGTVTGNITASTAPTAAGHLVNKQYADNLVAGVDLSGIATNAAAIEALTNGAPELLNTLAELGDAIGDDENFAATITGQIGAETTARTNADTALSGRLDALEADPTTATDLAAEASARASADTALSNRLDTLEADPTTQTLLDAETAARTAADTAETNARTSADSALSGRLDTLEADPTTQTLLDAETAARIAGDALKLDLAGGTMSGAIAMGAGQTTTQHVATREVVGSVAPVTVFTGEGTLTQIDFTKPNFVVHVYGIEVDGVMVTSGTVTLDSGDWYSDDYTGDNVIDGNTTTRAFGGPHGSVITFVPDGGSLQINSSLVVYMNGANTTTHLNDGKYSIATATITTGSGASTTIGVDGTATFGGNVTASAAPTANGHLVNKQYADNLVAGVDLSGIATNAAAIEALTNGAPELLNTLNELANAIGDDENFATTVTNTIAAETTARTNADTALSGRLDTLEADPTTATDVTNAIATETSARQAADTAEANARTSADNALSDRLDTLEADPTTQTLLDAEALARSNSDTALSNRLGTLEADPTTQTLLDAETAARTAADTAEASARAAADALLLPLAGGTMTGDIELGSGAGEQVTTTITGTGVRVVGDIYEKPAGETKYLVSLKVEKGTNATAQLYTMYIDGNYPPSGSGTITGGSAVTNPNNVWSGAYTYAEADDFILVTFDTPLEITENGSGFVGAKLPAGSIVTLTISDDASGGGSGSASTIGVDGTASFGGNVTAAAVPTDAAHLVNKLYADNLVAGVDLSGIATNAAAIAALTNGAPELLNTLDELANALGDDENFATTVTNQIASETTARTNADNALSGRLDTLEADPTTQAALTAESVARINADNALSGRLDTLEADPTTATDLAAEATARTNADNALSGRLDTLEADPTTQTLLDAETTARTNADTLLSGRLDTLEADPTTASALAAEATTRADADTALSGRLDTLEADPTTATAVTNAIAVETAARQAADALLLPLAGGTMSGDLNVGSGAPAQQVFTLNGWHPDGNGVHEVISGSGVFEGIKVYAGTQNNSLAGLTSVYVDGVLLTRTDNPGLINNSKSADGTAGWYSSLQPANFGNASQGTATQDGADGWVQYVPDAPIAYTSSIEVQVFTGNNIEVTHTPDGGGGGAAATTIGVDGSATFGGNITSAAVPTDAAHLVNKLYADNLVAGVDLSGIATNAAAIQALTNGAPELLNTLQELAAALGDDANFSTTVTGQIAANEVHIDNVATLSGVAKDSTNLGVFTGSTISDTSTIKAALQALETAIETPSTASQIQTIEQTANGTFHVTFVDSNNGSATAESLFTDSGLTYNPSTDLLSGGSIDMTTLLLDGVEVTATGAELNFLGGLTSSVQTQLDGKVTTGANINTLVGDTVAGEVPVDINGTDNYLFLVIDKANGALTAIDKTFLEAE